MDKPLHVRVAEALGWTDIEVREPWSSGLIVNPNQEPGQAAYSGRMPFSDMERCRAIRAHETGGDIMLPYQTGPHGPKRDVSRYDTDWSATGPLIERFGFIVYGADRPWAEDCDHRHADGATALEAICNLVVWLHENEPLSLAEAGEAVTETLLKGDCFFLAGDPKHVYCALENMPIPDLIVWPKSWSEVNRRRIVYLKPIGGTLNRL